MPQCRSTRSIECHPQRAEPWYAGVPTLLALCASWAAFECAMPYLPQRTTAALLVPFVWCAIKMRD